jgi:polynucleotide 5'-hydroxyl-kinase GRC3/NOL9
VLRDDAECLEVRLRADESACFIGEYHLQVVKGLVFCYGAMLHPGSGVHPVHAPSTAALPTLTAKKDDTVVRITTFSSGLRALEPLSPLFRNIGVDSNRTPSNRSFAFLSSTSDDSLQRPLYPLEISDGTRKVLSRVNARLEASAAPAPRIMTVGTKSSGKSTFNRLLCNMIVSRVATPRCLYLDLDPGQPEFGPPGQLYLVELSAPFLGPAFAHFASAQSTQFRLVRSHSIAATSPKHDPEHYLECAADLIRHAPAHLPLVINSCGWVGGLGANILSSLTSLVALTDLVVLEPVDADLIQTLSSSPTPQIHRIPRRQRQHASRTPAELRAMQMLSYFHHRPTTHTWTAKPISRMRPYRVSYAASSSSSSTSSAGIAAIVSSGQPPHPDFLAEVLNGSIVALILAEPPNPPIPTPLDRTATESLPFPASSPTSSATTTTILDPHRTTSIGLALVRDIDVTAHTLHLVTPLPAPQIAALATVPVTLLRGAFDPPEWAYLEDLHAGKTGEHVVAARPWVDTSARGRGGVEASVWRLRHPPMARDVLR